MERAKLVSGKKTEPTETKHRRLPGNKAERKPKAAKLVCRYCGSDDLAPSFIKATRSPVSEVFQQALSIGKKGEEGEEQEVATKPLDERSGSKVSGLFFICRCSWQLVKWGRLERPDDS